MNKFMFSRINYGKLSGALVAAAYFVYCAANPTFGHFIDNVDLIIHEAGHVFMMFFGQFIYALGGSLFQILIPAVFAVYFLLRRDGYSTALMAMWASYNVVNVSVYMADSVVMKLPLLGGDGSTHDWNYLLYSMNALQYTHVLSNIVYGVGMTLLVTSIGACVWFSFGGSRLVDEATDEAASLTVLK